MAVNLPAFVVPPPSSRNPIYQSLAFISFGREGNRNSIHDEGVMEAFGNFVGLNSSNIRDMASGFSKKTTAQGNINFGMWHVKYTLAIMHWAQYDIRCSCTLSSTGITNAE